MVKGTCRISPNFCLNAMTKSMKLDGATKDFEYLGKKSKSGFERLPGNVFKRENGDVISLGRQSSKFIEAKTGRELILDTEAQGTY